MALITPDELLQHVESDLGEEALTLIIASEDAEIVTRYGPLDTVTEQHIGGGSLIILSQRAQSISSITYYDGYTAYPLPPVGGDATQYYRLANGSTVELFGCPDTQRFTITYVPADTAAQRRLVLIQLCKLAIAYSGYSNQNDPSGGESPLQYSQERERLLRQLAPKAWVFA